MKMICVDKSYFPDRLTLGKEYNIITTLTNNNGINIYYQLKDDLGQYCMIHCDKFISQEESRHRKLEELCI
jgi:hypothetical protein